MILKDYHKIYYKEGETDYQSAQNDAENEESKIGIEDFSSLVPHSEFNFWNI
jgi:hypothetical protein